MVFLIFVIPSPKVEAIVGVDDAALVILASLAAFGIAITAQGGIDSVGPWITDQFEEYVNSVGDSLSSVWDRFRSGVTKAGQLALDGFTLRYNAKFGEWLVNKFSLANNDSINVDSVSSDYSLGGYTVYPLPVTFPAVGNKLAFSASSNISDSYLLFTVSGTRFYAYAFAHSPFTVTYNGNNYNVSNRYNDYWYARLGNDSFPTVTYNYGTAYPLSTNQVKSLLDSYSSVVSSDFFPGYDIGTGVISVPGVGDYDDDDGILIDGLGSWGDSLPDVLGGVGDLTFPGDTTVVDGDISYSIFPADVIADSLVDVGALTTENSPGFYNGLPLVGGIPDIQFGNLWHYVTDWVNSMSGGLALIGGIMFSLPFVAAFYALVVILLVLSLWRLLRSA